MNITVAGIGYVGLANALVLAQKYHTIITDISKSKIDLINQKLSPIDDDNFQEFLSETSGHLKLKALKLTVHTRKQIMF